MRRFSGKRWKSFGPDHVGGRSAANAQHDPVTWGGWYVSASIAARAADNGGRTCS